MTRHPARQRVLSLPHIVAGWVMSYLVGLVFTAPLAMIVIPQDLGSALLLWALAGLGAAVSFRTGYNFGQIVGCARVADMYAEAHGTPSEQDRGHQ
ncbi:hypothetical protein NLX83_39635 [Allokutzneria sp. A3M-2-11 16]|uniref:hypothetical protein n=1 Tax=Allokutzneria sp. A3M-2-11 16 TaxID=2962043 RepID=UPI0020B76694|nr:hypothetical protein [Allokutzneria sp. A3M-2-11 16]MCP3805397.1 hypothetical protein [Allokutzneria sp. A3M-2-11 16]